MLPIRRAAVLAALALLASRPAPAQAPAFDQVYTITADDHGHATCRVASGVEAQAFTAARRAAPRLTPLPSLNAERGVAVSPFRIVLRATDRLLAQPRALLAFRRAAATWERIIQNDVTAVIDVDYGPEFFNSGPYPNPLVLGATSQRFFFTGATPTASDVLGRLRARAADAQLEALYDAVPLPTPSTSPSGNLNRGFATRPNAQVLGYLAADDSESAAFDDTPSIGFNSAFAFDFDPTDGISPGLTDFEGVAVHEIGHALGFVSAIGVSSPGADPLFSVWDLFRVRPDAVAPGESLTDGAGFEAAERVVTPGPVTTDVLVVENGTPYYEPAQTFFDGLAEYDVSTATGTGQGGDGNQASHWRDDALRPPSLGEDRTIGIMDPNLASGVRDEIQRPDIRMLEVIGYDVVYEPPTTTLALEVGGRAIDEGFIIDDPVPLGDGPAGTYAVPIVLGNVGGAPLDFRLEAQITDVYPASRAAAASFSAAEGTVAVGASTTVDLRIATGDQTIGAGTLRITTNDDDRDVVEVPFTFTTGGAALPELAVSGVPATLGDVDPGASRSATLSFSNAGTFDLAYRVVTTLVTTGLDFPTTTDPAAAGRAASRPVLFSTDFEGAAPLSGFGFNAKAAVDRWQVRTTGPATRPGHSAPTVLYYGDAGGADEYSDNTVGQITLPPVDVSGVEAGTRVTLSFAHYLQAEPGDFATVLVSYDGGATFDPVATSDGGVLQNTDGAWETVTVDLPGAAASPEPVVVAFRFTSDASVTDEGWYLDDLAVDATGERSPFFVAPVAGTIPGGGTVDLTLTADATALEAGFYRALVEVRTDQPGPDPEPYEVAFTVGDPTLPGLEAVDATPLVAVEAGTRSPAAVRFRNAGDATLSFVRVLEPAASRLEAAATRLAAPAALPPRDAGARVETEALARTSAGPMDDGDVLGAVSFGTTRRFFDIAQYPDGRVVAVDGSSDLTATAFVLPRDLMDQGETFSSTDLFDGAVTGVAYNDRTGSLWFTIFETATLAEVVLEGGAVVPTGRTADLDFTPFGMDYSPELDAFLIGSFDTGAVLAVTAGGDLLPGYPAFVVGRDLDAGATGQPGVSVTRGLLEMTGAADELLFTDQFGGGFGASGGAFSDDVLGGSVGLYALLRDRTDPDGSFFVTTRPEPAGTPTRLVRIDPPDVPAAVAPTRVLAGEPLFRDRSVEAQEPFTLTFVIDAEGAAPGETTETVAFLTNDPATPVDRISLVVSTSPVAGEPGLEAAFAVAGVRPNPARGPARVAFSLGAAAEVTVGVYDALGRRVALAADGRLGRGRPPAPPPGWRRAGRQLRQPHRDQRVRPGRARPDEAGPPVPPAPARGQARVLLLPDVQAARPGRQLVRAGVRGAQAPLRHG